MSGQLFEIRPLGDSAVIIRMGAEISEKAHRRVYAAVRLIESRPFQGFIECIPSYTTLSVHYDLAKVERTEDFKTIFDYVCSLLQKRLGMLHQVDPGSPEVIDIPVCYGGEYGPDLGYVATLNGLTEEEVIRLHSESPYLVYALGFAPGFPYIGGMPDSIAAPRKQTPRLKVPPGSVGIAGNQTGIYPIETPGGWQIIGRTPLTLFRPEASPPALLQGGHYIRFRPITEAEFAMFGGGAL